MRIQDVRPGSLIRYDGREYAVSNIYHGLNMILVYDINGHSKNIWGPEEVDIIGRLTSFLKIHGNSESVVLTENGSVLCRHNSRAKFISLLPVIKDLQSVRAGSMIEFEGKGYIVSTVSINDEVLMYSMCGSPCTIPFEAVVKVLNSSNKNELLTPVLEQLPAGLVKGQIFRIGVHGYLTIGAVAKPSLITNNGSILNMKDTKSAWSNL